MATNPLLPIISKETAEKQSKIFRILGFGIVLGGLLFYILRVIQKTELGADIVDITIVLIVGLCFLIVSLQASWLVRDMKKAKK